MALKKHLNWKRKKKHTVKYLEVTRPWPGLLNLMNLNQFLYVDFATLPGAYWVFAHHPALDFFSTCLQ